MPAKEGLEGAIALRRWRRASSLTRHAAALELGVSERILAYYEAGERPVPRAVILAVRALTAGLDDKLDGNGPARERWVVLVRNILDYGKGVPVVGRILRSRDRVALADFISFIKQGPDPVLALTDQALFQSMRAAVTRAQLSGLASYKLNPNDADQENVKFPGLREVTGERNASGTM